MKGLGAVSQTIIGIVVAIAMSAGPVVAGPDLPQGKSAAAVKALTAALDAKHLEAFGTHDGDPYKFVAVLMAPGVQILAISATYDRPGDLDYDIAHSSFEAVYAALRSAEASHDKIIIEDLGANGLTASPPHHDDPPDTATLGTTRTVFNGNVNDPNHHDARKAPYDEYVKAFTSADAEYTRILGVLTDALKK